MDFDKMRQELIKVGKDILMKEAVNSICINRKSEDPYYATDDCFDWDIVNEWGTSGDVKGIHYDIEDYYTNYDDWYDAAIIDFAYWYIEVSNHNNIFNKKCITKDEFTQYLRYEPVEMFRKLMKEVYGEMMPIDSSDSEEDEP